jgi:AraC-like DNA-binding protein
MNIISIGKSKLLREYPAHDHAWWECAYYLKGRGTVFSGDQRLALEPGVFACSPPGVDHREQAAGGFLNLVVAFRTCDLPVGSLLAYHDQPHRPLGILLEMMETEFYLKHDGWETTCDRLLDALLAYLTPRPDRPLKHASVEKLEHVLLAKISQPGFRVQTALRDFDISQFYFSRLFKQQTGQTPLQYLLRRRIEAAGRLLQSTGQRIEEIARQVGFEDPYYFSRTFRKIKGCSPRAFRRQ